MSRSVNHIAPEGHPIWILMEEHAALLGFAEKMAEIAGEMLKDSGEANLQRAVGELETNFTQIQNSQKHYLREENVLFPILEKHGISGPTKVMWMEHDQIRGVEKKITDCLGKLKNNFSSGEAKEFYKLAAELAGLLASHFNKENNILFPAGMEYFTAGEFAETKKQFGEIGYCPFTPGVQSAETVAESGKGSIEAGLIDLGTGKVTAGQLEAFLNALPVEITFIDAEDTVRYYSKPKDMIFTRTKAIIGRKVQLCHPEKSVHLVEMILKEFKAGRRDAAEFWLNLGEKYVYIRYFPVRNSEGKYMGCMEVTQDIAPLQKISGEKRLLDWE